MNKPNVPDEIWLGKEAYSAWKDLKVNGWLMAAALISGASDIVFRGVVRQWPVPWQAIVAVIPFLAILLWVRSLARWIRGMDELHRRITVSAILFAISASFFVVMLWHRLVSAGAFPAKAGASWDIGTIGHVFLLLTFFYFVGHRLFNRRYE